MPDKKSDDWSEMCVYSLLSLAHFISKFGQKVIVDRKREKFRSQVAALGPHDHEVDAGQAEKREEQ